MSFPDFGEYQNEVFAGNISTYGDYFYISDAINDSTKSVNFGGLVIFDGLN